MCFSLCAIFRIHWVRFSRVVRASDSQCRSRYSPGFNPSMLRLSGSEGRQMKQYIKKQIFRCRPWVRRTGIWRCSWEASPSRGTWRPTGCSPGIPPILYIKGTASSDADICQLFRGFFPYYFLMFGLCWGLFSRYIMYCTSNVIDFFLPFLSNVKVAYPPVSINVQGKVFFHSLELTMKQTIMLFGSRSLSRLRLAVLFYQLRSKNLEKFLKTRNLFWNT